MSTPGSNLSTRVATWLARDPDPQTRAEITRLHRSGQAHDQAELAARFAGRVQFGTAGLRALLGGGPTRLNRLVVQETSLGLATYLDQQIPDARQRGVVVAYDGRHGSKRFAQDVAAIFGARGWQVHLFSDATATPLCAFAVKQLAAAAGVMITASHNPANYNGYKIFWSNGAQIIPPHDQGIAAAIEAATTAPLVSADLSAMAQHGQLHELGRALIERYLQRISPPLFPCEPLARGSLKIAYTPLHGVGAPLVERALEMAGFTGFSTVTAQRACDPDFPSVASPNPEEPDALAQVLQLARGMHADLACATDPDADRLAAAVLTPSGAYRVLSGDEIGVLLGDALLRQADPNSFVVTTLVSSRLLGRMAQAHHVEYLETLTGFKWMANAAIARQQAGKKFLLAYEEALGYCLHDFVWDKDGITAMLALCQLAAQLASHGSSLLLRLEEIYRTYGLHLTAQANVQLAAAGGAANMVGERLRQDPPQHVAGHRVTQISDYARGETLVADGSRYSLQLPRSDVLVYHLAGGARVIVRPSGTEPKIKCYYEWVAAIAPHAPFLESEMAAQGALSTLISAHQRDLAALTQS